MSWPEAFVVVSVLICGAAIAVFAPPSVSVGIACAAVSALFVWRALS